MLVPRRKTTGISETMACRIQDIFTFMWFSGHLSAKSLGILLFMRSSEPYLQEV